MADTQSAESTDYPFAALVRATDRDRILVQIMASVWESILGLPILPRPERDAAEGEGTGRVIVGAVRIEGAWSGAVELAGPQEFAAGCTARMHQRPVELLSDREVRDGWGELVNMVGGNLKAMVPPVSRLGLPEVASGETPGPRPDGLRVLNDLTFACQGSRIRLTVLRANR